MTFSHLLLSISIDIPITIMSSIENAFLISTNFLFATRHGTHHEAQKSTSIYLLLIEDTSKFLFIASCNTMDGMRSPKDICEYPLYDTSNKSTIIFFIVILFKLLMQS